MGRTRTSTPYRRTALDRVRLPSFATNAQGEGPQGIEPCSCAGRAHALTIVLRVRGGLVDDESQQGVRNTAGDAKRSSLAESQSRVLGLFKLLRSEAYATRK